MIKAVKIKETLNRESLGQMQSVLFNTIIGMTEEGEPELGRAEAKIHYYERGEGDKVILMLHGAAQSLYTYRNNFDELAKQGFRVIIPDLLGCGYSDCPDIDYSVSDMSLSLQSFLANLGITSVNIVAFGQACAYAADIANCDSELVRSMAFIHPGKFSDTNFPKAKALTGIAGNMAAGSFSKEGFTADYLDYCYFDKTLISERMVGEYKRPFEEPALKSALRNMVISYDDEEVLDKLVAYKNPILLVRSDDDPIHSEADFKRYLHAAQVGYTAVFRNCGYLPQEEKHDMFNSSVVEFLNY